MSNKNFKVKNGLTLQGTVDTLITPNNAGGILIGGSALSSYAEPEIGSTLVASGATVTTLNGVTNIVFAGPGSITDQTNSHPYGCSLTTKGSN
jgi:hypothetical protein